MNFYFLSSKSIDAYAYVNKFTHSISECEYCESNDMIPSFPLSYELTGKKIGDTAFMLGNRLFSDHFADVLNDNLISLSSITSKARNIDKNRQKWYNRSARKIA